MAADAYYNTAVSWLVGTGITAGVAPGKYAPNANVTRAQMAVFLHTNSCGTKPIAVDGGERHNCALKADGTIACWGHNSDGQMGIGTSNKQQWIPVTVRCLLYTSDAADERSSVDLGGPRIIQKKKECANQHKQTRSTKEERYKRT